MSLGKFSPEEIEYIISEVAKRVQDKLGSVNSPQVGSVNSLQVNSPQADSVCAMTGQNCSPDDCGGCGECASKNVDGVRQILSEGADRIGAQMHGAIAPKDVAPFLDHTLLKANASEEEVIKLCSEAKAHGFASVCINPSYIELAAKELKGSGVMVCTVIGFPLGAMTTQAKKFETIDAIKKGADEIDMVINVGKLKSGDLKYVQDDIKAVVNAANGTTVKVILETAMLSDEEKVKGCYLAKSAGAHYVKTSTGFGPGGATAKDIALMRSTVGPDMGVKASGGIRDYETAAQMIKSGATRIGASASINIVQNKSGGKGY